MPRYYEEVGANIYNDTAMIEHGPKDDKFVFNRTSKRYGKTLAEMVNTVMFLNVTYVVPYVFLCKGYVFLWTLCFLSDTLCSSI